MDMWKNRIWVSLQTSKVLRRQYVACSTVLASKYNVFTFDWLIMYIGIYSILHYNANSLQWKTFLETDLVEICCKILQLCSSCNILLTILIIHGYISIRQDVGHGHMHHKNNCIFVKLLPASLLVNCCTKIWQWRSMGNSRYSSSISCILLSEVTLVRTNRPVAEKIIYRHSDIGWLQLNDHKYICSQSSLCNMAQLRCNFTLANSVLSSMSI